MDENLKSEQTKRLAVTALSAFLGAFLGSYFIVHQFLTREYTPINGGFQGHMPFYHGEMKQNGRFHGPHRKKCCCCKKPMARNFEHGTVYVIYNGQDIKDFPMNFDKIREKIMQMR